MTSRERSCVYSVNKTGDICEESQVDDQLRECNQTDVATLSGSYGPWSPWQPCDFETCGNEGLYDARRLRRSCITEQNECHYVQHVQERKYCNMPSDSPTAFKLSPNFTSIEEGWREATVIEVKENTEQVKTLIEEYYKQRTLLPNGRYQKEANKWTVAKLMDGSVMGTGYRDVLGYEVDRNYTQGWGEVLLVQTGVKMREGDEKWSKWTPCDATCSFQLKKVKKDLGLMKRFKTCAHKGVWNGTKCVNPSLQTPSAVNCQGGGNVTFPGIFGNWSEYLNCDATTCGKSPKSNKLRSRSTCVSSNTTVTSNKECVMLYQFEEAKECEYIKKSDMDMLTPRIKIIASLGSWSVLFTVIIASAIMLRKKEAQSKKAVELMKNTKLTKDSTVEVQMEITAPEEKSEKKKKETKKKKEEETLKEEEDIVEEEVEMEQKAEDPLLQTTSQQC